MALHKWKTPGISTYLKNVGCFCYSNTSFTDVMAIQICWPAISQGIFSKTTIMQQVFSNGEEEEEKKNS